MLISVLCLVELSLAGKHTGVSKVIIELLTPNSLSQLGSNLLVQVKEGSGLCTTWSPKPKEGEVMAFYMSKLVLTHHHFPAQSLCVHYENWVKAVPSYLLGCQGESCCCHPLARSCKSCIWVHGVFVNILPIPPILNNICTSHALFVCPMSGVYVVKIPLAATTGTGGKQRKKGRKTDGEAKKKCEGNYKRYEE